MVADGLPALLMKESRGPDMVTLLPAKLNNDMRTGQEDE